MTRTSGSPPSGNRKLDCERRCLSVFASGTAHTASQNSAKPIFGYTDIPASMNPWKTPATMRGDLESRLALSLKVETSRAQGMRTKEKLVQLASSARISRFHMRCNSAPSIEFMIDVLAHLGIRTYRRWCAFHTATRESGVKAGTRNRALTRRFRFFALLIRLCGLLGHLPGPDQARARIVPDCSAPAEKRWCPAAVFSDIDTVPPGPRPQSRRRTSCSGLAAHPGCTPACAR